MRYEVKMTCDEIYLPEVHSWVQVHPAGFVEAYPPRQVNSVYLDTVEVDCLHDHLDGVLERSKLRFRWYGQAPSAALGVLELKHKRDRLGWKEYNPIPVTFDLTAISWRDWMHQVRTYAEGNIALWLAWTDRPILISSYLREYYESSDGEVRITIDRDLAIFEQLTYSSPNLTYRTPIDSHVVIEVKAGAQFSRRVSDVLTSIPLYAETNSKYVGGVVASWHG